MKLVSILVLFIAMSLTTFAGTDPKDMKAMIPPTTSPSDAGFYVGVEGGLMYSDHEKINSGFYSKTTGPCCDRVTKNYSTSSTSKSGWGFVGGVNGGYNFSSYNMGGSLGLRLQPGVQVEGLFLSCNGYDAEAGFLNGVLLFKNNSIVTPFIGGGVGVEHFNGDVDATDFAVDGFAGVSERLAKHWYLVEEYHFIDAIGSPNIQQHLGTVGLTYAF